MDDQVFIAREKQLEDLNTRLAEALAGRGNICLITGEAGSGKTTLVNKFTRQVLNQHNDLVVAAGECDAQTGIGDAHLPFREILLQLTGDTEEQIVRGRISSESASRLHKIVAFSGKALVEVGPDLIGVFLPGVGLATRIGSFVAEKAGWLDKLEKLSGKPKPAPGESGLNEDHIFEQYANLLGQLSKKNPLILILDDLHWADSASISLLFHLGRRIGDRRILILGTYRAAEVAFGRDGNRHPLDKVLAEFKRYYGDIAIDLDQAVKDEGRRFVDDLIDSEPNQLSDAFVTDLFQHTGGHPLFTIETLRNMQERGDLILDDQGRWVESPLLDWDKLPTRVEGVI